MAGLTLPFVQSLAATDNTFEITITSGGGTAIVGNSFGTDQFGDSGWGIRAESDVGTGVSGQSSSGDGVAGNSTSGAGVHGSAGKEGSAGLFDGNVLVNGNLTASTAAGRAITAASTDPNNDAINATTSSAEHAAVSANNTSQGTGSVPSGFALWASSNATAIFARGNPAAYHQGDVHTNGNHLVTGDVILVNSSGDVAEDFDVEDGSAHVEPGTVLVIGPNGKLCASTEPYDTKVAGVVSGAGELKPAIVLQRIKSCVQRSPIALVGKAFCKVDALSGSIAPGDLLTTSSRAGHAMKLLDRSRATGAILGKALGGLQEGQGLIPILVTPR